jgi:hypothetical protein
VLSYKKGKYLNGMMHTANWICKSIIPKEPVGNYKDKDKDKDKDKLKP